MRIRTLVAWVGTTFSYEPGDIIEVDDRTGRDRIDASLAVEDNGQPLEPVVHTLPPPAADPEKAAGKGKRGDK